MATVLTADYAAGGHEMTTPKVGGAQVDTINGEDTESDTPEDGFKSTNADQQNMQRMGKNQQLVRHFRVLSMASFVAIATAAWELGIFGITPGLENGGLPGLVWSVLWNFIGFGPIYFSVSSCSPPTSVVVEHPSGP